MKQSINGLLVIAGVLFFGLMFIMGPEQFGKYKELIFFIGGAIIVGVILWRVFGKGTTGGGNVEKFQYKMDELGYAKRKVVYDFLAPKYQEEINTFRTKYWWIVGIWLNYNEKKLILRTDKDNWTATVIRFSNIQSVELIEDGYTEISGATVGFGGIAVGSATSTSYVKGLQVRIVRGDINTGTEVYFINLYDPEWGTTFKKSDPRYKSIQECARSITDEIINIINHTNSI